MMEVVLPDSFYQNQQGNDIGTQYRSVIFFLNESQKQLAEQSRSQLDKSGRYTLPVVTEVLEVGRFWTAEEYHQDYYRRNTNAPYCQMVIQPKLKKLYNSGILLLYELEPRYGSLPSYSASSNRVYIRK